MSRYYLKFEPIFKTAIRYIPEINYRVLGVLQTCENIVTGTVEIGSQYPMHMETQICLAQPHEGYYKLQAATQVVAQMHDNVAAILGVDMNE